MYNILYICKVRCTQILSEDIWDKNNKIDNNYTVIKILFVYQTHDMTDINYCICSLKEHTLTIKLGSNVCETKRQAVRESGLL